MHKDVQIKRNRYINDTFNYVCQFYWCSCEILMRAGRKAGSGGRSQGCAGPCGAARVCAELTAQLGLIHASSRLHLSSGYI